VPAWFSVITTALIIGHKEIADNIAVRQNIVLSGEFKRRMATFNIGESAVSIDHSIRGFIKNHQASIRTNEEGILTKFLLRGFSERAREVICFAAEGRTFVLS